MKVFQLPRKKTTIGRDTSMKGGAHICGLATFYKLGKVDSAFE